MLTINRIYNDDCFNLLPLIPSDSMDFILADLPYGISRKSGYKSNSADKKDYISKYGKHSIDFGEWDKESVNLATLASEYFRVLKKCGVCVVFYDIWKSESLKKAFAKFNQPRIGGWIKTNPVPINSKVNLLSNATEYYFSFVKGGNPTFNGEYNNGFITDIPICSGHERTKHPTQKPLELIKMLVSLYSNEGDIVLDTHLGSGTTAIAAGELNRRFIGIEKNKAYFEMAEIRLAGILKEDLNNGNKIHACN